METRSTEWPVVGALKEVLGAEKILLDNDVSERYTHIWKMNIPLAARAVVLPRNTEEVATALRICREHLQPVVLHGGLSNMVGSTETEGHEVVISLEKMNQIEEVDTKSRTMTVQAGVVIEQIQQQAKAHGFLFPLNFGAKGSAQIGGAISTNAGGMRVFKFGMTRQLVIGLEAVLADGTVISSMKKIIKDNSAYDLKQLFIGSEGTLGVVTRAVLKMIEAPTSRNCALVGIDDYDKVVAFLRYMDRGLAGNLSCFELLWNEAYRTQTAPPASVKAPLPYDYKYYVLLESLGADQQRDAQIMEAHLAKAMEEGLILDAAMTHSESDLDWFFQIREDVHVMTSQCPIDQHFDISLPIAHIGPVINQMLDEMKQIAQIDRAYAFGHVADGNIHFIIGKTVADEALTKKINELVYSKLKPFGGSVSAEHGIGSHKKAYLHYCRSEAEIALMKTLKRSLDPLGLLNPGKVLG
ncbi:MAG: FAD-binding oxidoreductase [Bacteroidota bacterium]